MTPNIFKPILFNTEMVQANLENRKKQTRRICKVDPKAQLVGLYTKRRIWNSDIESNPNPLGHFAKFDFEGSKIEVKSKYTEGDVLWVRETWQCLDFIEDWSDLDEETQYQICYTYKASNDLRPDGISPEEHHGNWVLSSQENYDNLLEKVQAEEVEGRDVWYPSIHMPKEAARIFLKVTNVRCERLQDISKADAIAEGIEGSKIDGYRNYVGIGSVCAEVSFETLWLSINGKEHTWKSNPWVWVYDIERIEEPADFNL